MLITDLLKTRRPSSTLDDGPTFYQIKWPKFSQSCQWQLWQNWQSRIQSVFNLFENNILDSGILPDIVIPRRLLPFGICISERAFFDYNVIRKAIAKTAEEFGVLALRHGILLEHHKQMEKVVCTFSYLDVF